MRIEKDKVEETKEQDVIEIQEDVRVGEYILEKGDKIVILKEADDKEDEKKKDDEEDKEDKKDDEDKKKKETILRKLRRDKPLTMEEKKFIVGL